MTAERLDEQLRSAYAADRMPGLGIDRNELGEVGRARHEQALRRREHRCLECGELILGRKRNAKTCLVHRAYPREPSREELVAMLTMYMGAVEQLTRALMTLDAESHE